MQGTACSFLTRVLPVQGNADPALLQPVSLALAPAPIDREFRIAALVHPDSRAIPTPGTSLDTRTSGNLPIYVGTSRTTQIDGTETIAVVPAVAAYVEASIPARFRSPAATTVSGAATVSISDEASAAAAVDPETVPIDTPVLSTHAGRIGKLSNQACIAPRYVATRVAEVAAHAIDGFPATAVGLCKRSGRRRETTHDQSNCGDPTQYHI